MLIVLAAIAIIMLLYVIQMDTLFQPTLPSAPATIEKQPWADEHLLIPAEKTVKKPKAPKPLLTERFEIAGPAERAGQPRGQVQIILDTDGRVKAAWATEYSSEGKTHKINAEMAGNVNVKMDYQNANGQDETRLFFIAKGPYEHQTSAYGSATYISQEKGTAWLTGWLMPDRTAEGFVTITTDQKWSAEFAFEASHRNPD